MPKSDYEVGTIFVFTSFVYAKEYFPPDIVPIDWGYGRVHGHIGYFARTRCQATNKTNGQKRVHAEDTRPKSGTCSIYQRKLSPRTLPWPHTRLVHPILLAIHSSEVHPILAIVPDYGHSRPRNSPQNRQRRTSKTQPP